jgi:hypothetical protein
MLSVYCLFLLLGADANRATPMKLPRTCSRTTRDMPEHHQRAMTPGKAETIVAKPASSRMPLLLTVIGILLLIGCIPIPGDYKLPDGATRPEERIGAPNSVAPIQLDRTTLTGMTPYLGSPNQVSVDRRVAIFNYQVVTGRFLWITCAKMGDVSEPTLAQRYLLVRFHPNGRLESFQVYKDPREFPDDMGQMVPYAPH